MLDRLHLFVQIIFALGPLHLGFHACLDLFLDLKDGHFALHQAVNLLKPLGNAERFQQFLLLVHFNAQMPRHKIRQFRRLDRFADGGQRLFGDVLAHLGIALELVRHGAQQRLGGGDVARHLGQILGACLEKVIVFKIFGDAHPRLTFDQHLDGAVGQFQQLQHIGQHAGLVDACRFGIVLRGVDLAGQQDLLVVGHHFLERTYGFVTADEQRHDHMRKHHNVAQRQDRVRSVKGLLHALFLI